MKSQPRATARHPSASPPRSSYASASRCSCCDRQRVDLAQPRHVRQRPAERGQVAARVRPEVAQPHGQLAAAKRAVAQVGLERLEVAAVARRLRQHDSLPHDPLPLAPPHAANGSASGRAGGSGSPARRRLRRRGGGLGSRALDQLEHVLRRAPPRLLGPLAVAPQRRPHVVDLALLSHASEVRSGSGGSSLSTTAQRRPSPAAARARDGARGSGSPSRSSSSPRVGSEPGRSTSVYPCGDGTKASQLPSGRDRREERPLRRRCGRSRRRGRRPRDLVDELDDPFDQAREPVERREHDRRGRRGRLDGARVAARRDVSERSGRAMKGSRRKHATEEDDSAERNRSAARRGAARRPRPGRRQRLTRCVSGFVPSTRRSPSGRSPGCSRPAPSTRRSSSSRTAAPLSWRRATASSRRATGCGGQGSGLHETADALGLLGDLPFVAGDPGDGVEQTADDVDRFAVGVRAAGRDARLAGRRRAGGGRNTALVLGLAVALGPTVPAAFLYLLLRPLLGERLRRA